MEDENLSPTAAEQPTSSARPEISLSPAEVGPGESVRASEASSPSAPSSGPVEPAPDAPVKIIHAADPTSRASIRIGLREVEVAGPGSETRSLLISATTVAGLMSAGFTAGLASSRPSQAPWFLGLAIAQLILTLVVILLIARRDRGSQHSELPDGSGRQPPSPEPLPPGNPRGDSS